MRSSENHLVHAKEDDGDLQCIEENKAQNPAQARHSERARVGHLVGRLRVAEEERTNALAALFKEFNSLREELSRAKAEHTQREYTLGEREDHVTKLEEILRVRFDTPDPEKEGLITEIKNLMDLCSVDDLKDILGFIMRLGPSPQGSNEQYGTAEDGQDTTSGKSPGSCNGSSAEEEAIMSAAFDCALYQHENGSDGGASP